MKSIIVLITVFSSLFTPLGHAQTDVYRLLMSDETQSIRQAARIMTKGEQNTSANSHLLSMIIEKEFENAPSSRIDALSWGCRALAATGNNQYQDLLKRITLSKFAHKKLKKYANQAYQQLLSTEKVATKHNSKIITASNENIKDNLLQNKDILKLIPKASLTTIERQVFAIAKGEWQAIKFIAQQEVKTVNTANLYILDALSQFLIEMHIYNLDNEKIDVLSWICRALGHSNNGRYQSIVASVTEQATNKKLYNYAAFASNRLKKNVNPYLINSINFQQILNDFMQK